MSSHRLVCINFSHPPPPPLRSRFSQVLGGATVTSYYYNEDVPGRRFFSANNWDRRMGMKNGATRWFCSAQRSWNPGQQVGGTIKSSSLFFFLYARSCSAASILRAQFRSSRLFTFAVAPRFPRKTDLRTSSPFLLLFRREWSPANQENGRYPDFGMNAGVFLVFCAHALSVRVTQEVADY